MNSSTAMIKMLWETDNFCTITRVQRQTVFPSVVQTSLLLLSNMSEVLENIINYICSNSRLILGTLPLVQDGFDECRIESVFFWQHKEPFALILGTKYTIGICQIQNWEILSCFLNIDI